MPTGYTHKIAEGQSPREFLLGCALAFGACLHQRDEDGTHEPKPRIASTHHAEHAEKLRLELGELLLLTDEECEERARQEYEAEVERRRKRRQEARELRSRYEDALDYVRDWQPPTQEHHGLKKFAIDQLEQSLRYDCSIDTRPLPERRTGKEWRDTKEIVLISEIRSALSSQADENRRTADANHWIEALFASLPKKP